MFGRERKLKEIEASLDGISPAEKRRIQWAENRVRAHRIWAIAVATVIVALMISITTYELTDRIVPRPTSYRAK